LGVVLDALAGVAYVLAFRLSGRAYPDSGRARRPAADITEHDCLFSTLGSNAEMDRRDKARAVSEICILGIVWRVSGLATQALNDRDNVIASFENLTV
jgi:hypothetical protein